MDPGFPENASQCAQGMDRCTSRCFVIMGPHQREQAIAPQGRELGRGPCGSRRVRGDRAKADAPPCRKERPGGWEAEGERPDDIMGRGGGKWRPIPYHPDTLTELKAYQQLREEEIARAREKNPEVKVPDALLIYELGGKLYPYKKTAIDNILCRLGKGVGFHFSNHDLRRTGGRLTNKSGVPIERIAKILGHKDIKTTIEYLGLNNDDMSESLAQYAQYMKNPFEPEMVQNELIQEKSGQSGIFAPETVWLNQKVPRSGAKE